MTMSWASVVMANDAEERAVVMASMNAIGQAIAAGTQVVQWPATSAPDFRAGQENQRIREEDAQDSTAP